jgi:hypothetical protein
VKNHRYLYLITLAFFGLALVNIHFAILGVICMTIPLYLLQRDQKKTWCQGYCPRSSLFMALGKKRKKKGRVTPMSFIRGNVKNAVLVYFGISLFISFMSTLQVFIGNMAPMLIPRFLILLPVNVTFPQIITVSGIPVWITHFAFRMFSMMMTTTIIGISLSYIYKPRTWCTICPVNTISDIYIMENRKRSPGLSKEMKAS